MKPLLSLAGILVLLAACSGDGTQTTQTIATPEQSATTPAPETEAPQTTTYSTPPPAGTATTDAEMYRMTATELKQRVDAGEAVVVVDVRSRVAYATEHGRGAVNIPLEEIGMRSAELPTDKWLVAYCT
ncbi:MAG: rhodanese-like domain-containing protein [Thermoanaerobaculia bacterium]